MKRRTQLTLSIAAVLVGFFVLGSGPAFGMHVTCGTTITVDTVLDSNLIGCTGNGITIGVNGIVLNLNGFIIDGNRSGGGIGVLVGNRLNVTITGPGVVREFGDAGILITGGSGNQITNLVVADNTIRGIHTLNSSNNIIEGNTAYDNLGGIQISGGSGNEMRQNDLYNINFGILVSGFGNISGNNIISKNNIHNNGLTGIAISSGNNNVIEENQISRNNRGIHLGAGGAANPSDANIVEENVITNNAVGVDVGSAPVPVPSNNNKIADNIVADNSNTGVRIGAGNTNVIEENTFSANGIQITDTGTGTVLVDNICDPPVALCN